MQRQKNTQWEIVHPVHAYIHNTMHMIYISYTTIGAKRERSAYGIVVYKNDGFLLCEIEIAHAWYLNRCMEQKPTQIISERCLWELRNMIGYIIYAEKQKTGCAGN